MEILCAQESHVPQVMDLWKEFMNHHAPIDYRFPLREDAAANMEKHLREVMKSEDTLVIVAVEGDEVRGYSIAEIDRRAPLFQRQTYGTISDMAVKGPFRRNGIGERMFDEVLKWYASRGIDEIELSVDAKNEIGKAFWRKHGFEDHMYRLVRRKRGQ